MIREKLLDELCPDSKTYGCCNDNCDSCNEIKNKLFDEYDKQIRNEVIDECINTIVSTESEVALKEPFNAHLFDVMADRQNEIIKLLEQLKEQSK